MLGAALLPVAGMLATACGGGGSDGAATPTAAEGNNIAARERSTSIASLGVRDVASEHIQVFCRHLAQSRAALQPAAYFTLHPYGVAVGVLTALPAIDSPNAARTKFFALFTSSGLAERLSSMPPA